MRGVDVSYVKIGCNTFFIVTGLFLCKLRFFFGLFKNVLSTKNQIIKSVFSSRNILLQFKHNNTRCKDISYLKTSFNKNFKDYFKIFYIESFTFIHMSEMEDSLARS